MKNNSSSPEALKGVTEGTELEVKNRLSAEGRSPNEWRQSPSERTIEDNKIADEEENQVARNSE